MDSTQRARAILSFVQAADAGSFAAAGRMLGVSSAAVSKNVAALEKALGVRLMNRTTRTLTLTEEGSVFLRHARVALEALDTAVETVTTRRAGPNGRVRISTVSSFGRDWLLPKLPVLLARYPGLSVEVDFDDRVVDLVRDGYDLAIRGGIIQDSALVSRAVCHLHTAVVAAPDYIERAGRPERPEDLAAHRLIARRFLGGRVSPWSFRAADGSVATFDPTDAAVLTLSAPETVVQAACAGVGIAQVGLHLAWPYLKSGALKVVLHDRHHPGSYEMVVLYPHRALIAPRVRVTLDHLVDAFAADESLHVPLASLANYRI